MSSLKVLVAGDVEGNFKELFSRVAAVNEKNGPFNLLLCVGSFFNTVSEESEPLTAAPILTLVLGPTTQVQLNHFSNMKGCELADNVVYLGQSGIYRQSSGLTIAYIGGLQNKDSGDTETSPIYFSASDIKNLRIRTENEPGGFQGVDILLSSQWPAGVLNRSPTQPDGEISKDSNMITLLSTILKPRYHFAGMEGVFFERPPYRNHEVLAEAARHVTRFIGLAKVGNEAKKRWLYAFNIVPQKFLSRAELVKEFPNVTESPYSSAPSCPFRAETTTGVGYVHGRGTAPVGQFFYDTSYTGTNRGYRGGRGRGGGGRGFAQKRSYQEEGQGHSSLEKRRFQPNELPPGTCWFCLASPEVEKHLVLSIGNSVYTTLAKGGLTDDHVLILPIGHFQSTIDCPPDVIAEIDKFKDALKKYFATQQKAVVFYERNFKSPHLQIQAVPVDVALIPSLKSSCMDYAESEGIQMQDYPPNAQIHQLTRGGFPYFYLELPDTSKLFVQIRKNFPVQFGRELLASASILNISHRVDWKACKVSKEEETKLTQAFRKAFKSFDFTIE